MKILHTVEQYNPSVGGMQEVVKQLSERLVALGHEVTVATAFRPDRAVNNLNGVKIESFKISGNEVKGYQEEADEIKRYQDFLINSGWDIITNFAAQQWATDLMLPILDNIKARKVLIPTGFSGLYDHRYQEYFSGLSGQMKKYDLNIFLSADYRDINFAREKGIDKLMVIPNGAAADEFLGPVDSDFRNGMKINKDNFLILLVGSHTGRKGHKEAIKIFSAAKLPPATLVIIANTYKITCYLNCKIRSSFYNLFHRNQILIVSASRSETVSAYRRADLFLFPSNIECSPLVLFEAMASRTPFLTADVGNAKEIIRWSQGGKLLPTKYDRAGYSRAQIKESALILKEVVTDGKLREILAQAGFQSWQERFTWEKIARDYEAQYKKLLEIL